VNANSGRMATTGSGSATKTSMETLDDITLHHWIGERAASQPEAVAIRTASQAISFAALHKKALSFARFLQRLGLQRGDVIAAQLPNSTEFVVTYLAAGYIGATFQTVHMAYRAAEIEPLLAHSGAKAIVCMIDVKDFSPAESLASLRQKLPALQHIIAVGAKPRPGIQNFSDNEQDTSELYFDPVTATDRFLLLYTSGTTAAPKGVPVTFRNFLPNAALSARALGIDNTSVLLSAAPFTHLYGLFSLNLAFAAGASTALLPSYAPAALAEALDDLKPTGLFVAPAHLAACLNEGLLTKKRLASLRFALISGSTCRPTLAHAIQELMDNGEVLQLWGMSELQAGSFTRPGDKLQTRLTTVGRASPRTELRVAQEASVSPLGIEGELQVRGPSLFDAYMDNSPATVGAFTDDGWFRTGDLARMDQSGNIQITGRLKDIINRGGVKFNPTDVEALIERHVAVANCAIVPVHDPVLGERACCFIVPTSGTPHLQLEEVCRWLAEHDVAKLKWPERLELIDSMPMTPTRKIMKGELAKRAAVRK
jgi:cyclohexanecarboxylate-CoA ligase